MLNMLMQSFKRIAASQSERQHSCPASVKKTVTQLSKCGFLEGVYKMGFFRANTQTQNSVQRNLFVVYFMCLEEGEVPCP
jgi:hypothetical protein